MSKKLKKYKVVYNKEVTTCQRRSQEVEAASKSEAVLLFDRAKYCHSIVSVERVKE